VDDFDVRLVTKARVEISVAAAQRQSLIISVTCDQLD